LQTSKHLACLANWRGDVGRVSLVPLVPQP
jgi:hypothetical protein